MEDEVKELSTSEQLDKQLDELVNNTLVDTKTQDTTQLFNSLIAKKSMIRASKLNNLLDRINDEALNRLLNNYDEISNKDLIAYMNAVQTQLEKSQNNVNGITTQPTINIQQNNVNIGKQENEPTLSREARARILDAINSLIASTPQDEVVEGEILEEEESENE